MISFFWKYRRLNFIVIFVFLFFCIYSFDSFKVYFDSERIIELVDIEEDIIEKSIDDRNLLLIGVELNDSLSFPLILQLDTIINNLQKNQHVRSVRSLLNEKVIVNQLIPIPIKLFRFDSKANFNTSLLRIQQYPSRFATKDFKSLLLVVKCQNLDSESKNIKFFDFLDEQFIDFPLKNINITGQVKSEIYMKKYILHELMVFILFSSVICSLVLFYFLRNYKLIFICLFSIFISITFCFSISNFMFGGVELVMIIIPAIIFIINISDYMHLLNIQNPSNLGYKLFYNQLNNIGKPVFLTSLTTAIGFLSFTFGSFEPLMRFGLVTTLSIFLCLYVIVTFFAFIIEFNMLAKNTNVLNRKSISFYLNLLNPYKKLFLVLFVVFACVGFMKFKVDNYLTDELNNKSDLFQEISFIEEKFGGVKPLSFTLLDSLKNIKDHINFLESNDVSVDLVFNKKDTTLIKTRIRDIGALRSNILYNKINEYSKNNGITIIIGGVGYLFDKISNSLTYEVLAGLMLAILIIGIIFVFINNINYKYFVVSLVPNILPLFSCLGIFALFGFYLSLSNAFIFAIVFGLIVDDSVHIISAYSISRRRNKSIQESIQHCQENTFHAVIKTTFVIIVSLFPLLFSQFTSISQLAYITITAAIIALIFDILLLPILLAKYIR